MKEAHMSDPEKWGWWTIGVVALTIAAYGAFVAVLGHGPATSSVFALLALTAIPASSRRHFKGRTFDEREREIAHRALRVGFSVFWLAFVGLDLAICFIKGWDTAMTVPVWALDETLWWAASLVLGVQALTTIVLHRGVPHA
jgi:NADH:ubiquinone oxidoreductase subunit 3 (subunit A)